MFIKWVISGVHVKPLYRGASAGVPDDMEWCGVVL